MTLPFLVTVGCTPPPDKPAIPLVEVPPAPSAAQADETAAIPEQKYPPLPQLLVWEKSELEAVKIARYEHRPFMIDFTAEWCAACKELVKVTFADGRVQKRCKNFVAVRVDVTDDEDPQGLALKKKYNVVGLPTVIVFDSAGNERARFTEFVAAEQFLQAIEGIR